MGNTLKAQIIVGDTFCSGSVGANAAFTCGYQRFDGDVKKAVDWVAKEVCKEIMQLSKSLKREGK